ncbi:protein vav isoform X2 [Ischnura elegans]|uniref:protein vav isoform X2 n=1 Tax=Ischnura elegans TaxID=197161 RepID=UPI001ED8B768|nr:protein vav isoform X2 [Ischnura elegans]
MARELWRDCATWLTKCEVLRQDHKANWPEATVIDLAYTLRDGVLLCNLLNMLDPGCIDMKEVNQKPQMAQFLCLRNIKIFLRTCKAAFGIKDEDLFDPPLLFDLSDFFKVLNTLSKLSNCPKVQRRNIPGFTAMSRRPPSQDDIYRNLNSSVVGAGFSGDEGCSSSNAWKPPRPPKRASEWPEGQSFSIGPVLNLTSDEDEMENSVYEDLCYVNFSFEASRRIVHPMVDHGAASVVQEKRDYIINELVETEGNYLQVLVTVINHFKLPLSAVLRREDSAIIFAWYEELCDIHTGFHEQLRIACGHSTPDGSHLTHRELRLGDVFMAYRENFLIYGDYCTNLLKAQDLLQSICSRSEIINQEVIKCQQEANKGKFKLRDILSVPMQRILKYHLLLEKLVSETPTNHEDYRSLEQAKEAMIDVAQCINEIKKDSDTLEIMHKIQRSIVEWNMPENTELKDYGRLIKDGDLKIKAHDDQKVKLRYVFIFDQMMLMCKTMKGDQFKFRECLRLWEYKVADEIGRRTLDPNIRWSYQWYLYHKTEKTAYTLYARTEDLKRKWIKAITDALDNINPSGCKDTDHKFQMRTVDRATTCNHCNKFLKGILFQGYRCERCLISVHKHCIPNSGRCGQIPPELPPRPPLPSSAFLPTSHQLPANVNSHLINVYTPEQGAHAHGNISSWEASSNDDHCQITLNPPRPSLHLWFVGEMGRERATALLEREKDGTYLVRIRPRGPTNPSESAYALSLKTDSKVKHMKVYEKENNGARNYCLSESRFFPSIVDLVDCYEQTSLGENFVGLDVKLQWPYGRTEAVVQFDFEPTDTNQLRLYRGRHLVVLGKEGDHKGWWKGRIDDQIGFFPKEYVREIVDSTRLVFPYGLNHDIP